MKSICIAGPLFNTADRSYLEHIAAVLEKAGFKTLNSREQQTLFKISSQQYDSINTLAHCRKRKFYGWK